MEHMPQQDNEFAILEQSMPESHEELLAYMQKLQDLARAHATSDQMLFKPIQDRMDEVREKLKQPEATV